MTETTPRMRIKELRYVTAATLRDHPRNWRLHGTEQTAALKSILQKVGIADAILAYESRQYGGLTILDGHLRKQMDPAITWPVLVLDLDDAEAELVLASHDAITGMAGVDTEALEGLMVDLKSGLLSDFEQDMGLGHLLTQIDHLMIDPFGNNGHGQAYVAGQPVGREPVDEDEDGYTGLPAATPIYNGQPQPVPGVDMPAHQNGQEPPTAPREADSDGSLLKLAKVTIAEPTNKVERGEIWQVGHHTLICADVFVDWPLWKEHIRGENTIFAPFPGPFVPLTVRAEEVRLIMVQPDPYIAGHILDQFVAIKGEGSVRRTHTNGGNGAG